MDKEVLVAFAVALLSKEGGKVASAAVISTQLEELVVKEEESMLSAFP